MHRSLVPLAAAQLAALLPSQNTVQIPLNYNFNGIAHAGETGQPDAPGGFRSISDRALDFTAGVPNAPVFQRFAVVAQAFVLDMVHLGNRNTVDGGSKAFDTVPDGDNIGVQPTWLANVDQAGPQITVLATPVAIGIASSASVLFHVSNGGGSCDVTFTYQSGHSSVRSITAPDWFGGSYAGRQNIDRADAGGNLNLVEAVIDLGADAGESLVQIAFSNRSNASAGYGIYAVNVEAAPEPQLVNHIPLAHNWNGIVHAGESGVPDSPNGYRSISTRGLDFSAGVPNNALLAGFELVGAPGVLDLVLLGNRDTVANASVPFDAVPDGDDVGVQPSWLASPDLTGPQTTTLAQPILLDAGSTASFLYQTTDGGGAFDVTFMLVGASITATLRGADWVGGSFLGRGNVDRALPGLPLRIETDTVDLGAAAGYVLTAITFENRSNPIGSCAVLAANVTGCLACANGGGPTPLGGGAGPTLTTTSTGNLGCAIDWQLAGATPSTPFGLFAFTTDAPIAVLLAVAFPACGSTVHVANPVTVGAAVDGLGRATLLLPLLTNPSFCGVQVTAQYVELVLTPCPLLLSDALSITIGN